MRHARVLEAIQRRADVGLPGPRGAWHNGAPFHRPHQLPAAAAPCQCTALSLLDWTTGSTSVTDYKTVGAHAFYALSIFDF
jgi:hypothetical protein